jgi:Tfp pilus assembly protein PilF
VPATLVFPTAKIDAEHAKRLQLLTHGHLPRQAPTALPGEWMVQPEWQTLLETSPHTAQDWYALLHVGVMRLEHCDAVGARAAWQASLALQPSAWAWRNLAVLARWDGDVAEAQRCMHQAWQLSPDTMEIAQEYMELLCAHYHFETFLD